MRPSRLRGRPDPRCPRRSPAAPQRRSAARKRPQHRPRHVTGQAAAPWVTCAAPQRARVRIQQLSSEIWERGVCGAGRVGAATASRRRGARRWQEAGLFFPALVCPALFCPAPPRPVPRRSAPHPFLRRRLPAGASRGQVRRERRAGPSGGRGGAGKRFGAASGPGASGGGSGSGRV